MQRLWHLPGSTFRRHAQVEISRAGCPRLPSLVVALGAVAVRTAVSALRAREEGAAVLRRTAAHLRFLRFLAARRTRSVGNSAPWSGAAAGPPAVGAVGPVVAVQQAEWRECTAVQRCTAPALEA